MKPRSPILVTIILVVSLIAGVFYSFLQDFDFLFTPIFLATTILSSILVLVNDSLNKLIDAQKFSKLSEEEKGIYLKLVDTPYYKRLWDGAFKPSLEEESGEVGILDHGYDGIVELDNQLPKWWLGLFYFGIIYCVIYMTAISFTDFANPDKEYETDFKKQKKEIEEYEKIAPQATIETAEYNPDYILAGKELFTQICVTCHETEGKGGSGPSLVDEYWINIYEGNLYKNIFYMIWNGSKHDATMRSFHDTEELKGNDIMKVASYVYSINQDPKKPSGVKAPQGIIAPWSKNFKNGPVGDGINTSPDYTVEPGFHVN